MQLSGTSTAVIVSGGIAFALPSDGVVTVTFPQFVELLLRIGLIGAAAALLKSSTVRLQLDSPDAVRSAAKHGLSARFAMLWLLGHLDSSREGRNKLSGAVLRFSARSGFH